ncbi:MAG: RNA polymerase sigma factor [Planctomycetota bacterium]|jgi:RNA polymerase sigma-70 factor (ECF subfamily)
MVDELETGLVESALAGDIDSFGELCSRYYSSMVAIAYSVLTDHHLAEDAAQEAFAKALKNLNKLRQKEKFARWLAQICRNTARDMTKSKLRQVNTEDLSQLPDSRNEDCNSVNVRWAIDRLPAAEKEIVVLRYYSNLSYKQISAVLGLSKPTVNGRLRRAKQKIIGYLKLNGFQESNNG